MTNTGGLLNILNGKMSISAAHNSVPVMKLIRQHNPSSRRELVELIDQHHRTDCVCGIRSTGTVQDFGLNLYHAQLPYWNEIKFSKEECIQWEYDLFIVQSLKGKAMEEKAIQVLRKYSNYNYEYAGAENDMAYRIDIVVKKGDNTIAGIQVKPKSYNKMREGIKFVNLKANAEWKHPVCYLLYDGSQYFPNLKNVLKELKEY